MNRIDRLTAILLRLQSGKRTAGELADHFEVSRRTILRDIQALSEMNIPVVAEVGVEGGYSLPDDYALPPLALTLHEAILLRLALSSLAQLGTTPFERERASLLDKAETLLPRHGRARLAQFAETLAVDLPAQPHPTPFLDRLLESARREEWVTATYRSARGHSQQTLLPRQLRTSAGLWYCEAYAHEHRATRVYRVDRFLAVQPALSPPQAAPPAARRSPLRSVLPYACCSVSARRPPSSRPRRCENGCNRPPQQSPNITPNGDIGLSPFPL